MAHDYIMHYSERGMPLVYVDPLPKNDLKIITVENYMKWYGLYVVSKDGIAKLPYDGTIAIDCHVINPADVAAYGERHGMEVDGCSMEIIIGRYVLEMEGREPEFIGAGDGGSEEARQAALSEYGQDEEAASTARRKVQEARQRAFCESESANVLAFEYQQAMILELSGATR